jgi:ABC-type Fe3+/spermidine/putrescine transport system ATPase subunit
MTARDQVAFPLRMRHHGAAEASARADQLLDDVGLAVLGDRLPAQLSGGQQQRVGLARALAGSPVALLLDEPLSNLDAQLREQMRDEVRAACDQAGVACLYVTHDQTEALALSDRVAVMSGGHILQDAPPQEVFRRPGSDCVAHIVGAGEVLLGRISGGGFEPDGLRQRLTAPRHPGLRDGDRAALVVHSSRMDLSCELRPYNSLPATVAGSAFLGDRWQVQCRLPSGQLLRANSDRAWPSGQEIWCSFSSDQAYITTCEER